MENSLHQCLLTNCVCLFPVNEPGTRKLGDDTCSQLFLSGPNMQKQKKHQFQQEVVFFQGGCKHRANKYSVLRDVEDGMERKNFFKWQWPATLKGTATYSRALNVFSHHVSLSSTPRLQDGFGPARLQLLRSALACLRLTTFS